MDLGHNINSFMGLNAQTVTNTAAEGTAFDRKGYEGLVVNCFLGAKSGTDAVTVTFTVQECSTSDGSFAAVAYKDCFGETIDTSTVITTTNASKEIALDLVAAKRYLKVVATPVATGSTYITAGAVAILGGALDEPV